MNIFVIFIFAVALLVLFLFLSGRDSGGDKKASPRPVVPTGKSGDKSLEIITANIKDRESQKHSLLDSYPRLKDVSPVPEAERKAPLTAEDLSRERMEIVRDKISTLKSMPTHHFTLINLLRNPESNMGKISSIVMTNPVFSAKILQSINSAYFNLPDKITSVGRAITLLGFNNVRSLVLQDALSNVFSKDMSDNADLYVKRWAHSAVVSVCSGYLGNQLFQFPENELATIGLLHDVGKYFIHIFESQEGGAADLPHLFGEERQYGINHAALGGLIAGSWQLSDLIVKTIAYHHHPVFLPPEAVPEACRKQCFIISLADLICKALGYAVDDLELLQINNEYYDSFDLTPSLPEFITPELIRKIEKAHIAVQSYSSTV